MDCVTRRRPLIAAIALALAAAPGHAATIAVTSGADNLTANDGLCTLREALTAMNFQSVGASGCVNIGAFGTGDTIEFAAALAQSTITFGPDLGALQIGSAENVTIDGSGQRLDAGGMSRVLYVSAGATLVARNLTITHGNATRGGGLCSYGGTVRLGNVVVQDNSATSAGGGVYANAGVLTLANSTVSGNTAFLGGGLADDNGTMILTDSTIAGNTAGIGGGLSSTFAEVRLVNTTISGNTAVAGEVGGNAGGARSYQSSFALTNCTVSGNTAANAGGGIATYAGPSAAMTTTFANSILSANQAASATDLDRVGDAVVTASYSVLGSALDAAPLSDTGNHNVFSDAPGLSALAQNGGPTPTMALSGASSALAAGSPALALNADGMPLNYDQRGVGFPRELDATVDIGAFQHQGDRVFADGLEPEP